MCDGDDCDDDIPPTHPPTSTSKKKENERKRICRRRNRMLKFDFIYTTHYYPNTCGTVLVLYIKLVRPGRKFYPNPCSTLWSARRTYFTFLYFLFNTHFMNHFFFYSFKIEFDIIKNWALLQQHRDKIYPVESF